MQSSRVFAAALSLFAIACSVGTGSTGGGGADASTDSGSAAQDASTSIDASDAGALAQDASKDAAAVDDGSTCTLVESIGVPACDTCLQKYCCNEFNACWSLSPC